ncbi:universal stress protein [Aureibaculum marinum]|uniref:Universal stress protein n=1 Tax=Aureibaculum marinum TaxID=2487930 RepID=A0A3N4NQ64_9FLAO|nr:universal stress protein [Aureibaculum marinum]RPD97755.1 universal stress protein [Aureibaculum marinum]
MKTILYATDLNKNEASVLKYAYKLSQNLNLTLEVFHIYQLPPVRVSVSRPAEQMVDLIIKEQKDIVKAYCEKHLGEDMSNIKVDVVISDTILDAILDKSKKTNPSIVVIGKKEKHTKRGLLASDIGLELLKKLTLPILIVPNTTSNKPVKTILYATDFEKGDLLAINKIVPLAKNMDAKIHVVHVSTKTEYAGKDKMQAFENQLSQQIDYNNIEFEVLFSENIEKELNAHAKRIDADIIVLLEREEKGFFQKLFTKGIAEKLEVKISIPLMSFNEPS